MDPLIDSYVQRLLKRKEKDRQVPAPIPQDQAARGYLGRHKEEEDVVIVEPQSVKRRHVPPRCQHDTPRTLCTRTAPVGH